MLERSAAKVACSVPRGVVLSNEGCVLDFLNNLKAGQFLFAHCYVTFHDPSPFVDSSQERRYQKVTLLLC
jgi:hypothetical protein